MSSEGVPDFIPLIPLGIHKLNEDVVDPVFATVGSACFDVFCNFDENTKIKSYTSTNITEIIQPYLTADNRCVVRIYNGYRVMIPTGIVFDIPRNYSIRLHNRSGLALKNGIKLVNQEAVIDSDYVEETMILLENSSNQPYELFSQTRVCQAELVSNVPVSFFQRNSKPTSETRNGGFGSTGVS